MILAIHLAESSNNLKGLDPFLLFKHYFVYIHLPLFTLKGSNLPYSVVETNMFSLPLWQIRKKPLKELNFKSTKTSYTVTGIRLTGIPVTGTGTSIPLG